MHVCMLPASAIADTLACKTCNLSTQEANYADNYPAMYWTATAEKRYDIDQNSCYGIYN